MIERLLVANRGEIARRIMRTCRRMGIATVAIHSDVDAEAPHVREADDAVFVGPAPAATSYLAIDRVIAAAKESGASAIHPGYGFLSENAALAEACAAAGIVFVGPGPDAMRSMGDKVVARSIAEDAGVPVVPGGTLDGLDAADARALGEQVGTPLIVKAAAGGGGRGMRQVGDLADLPGAMTAARAEAEAAFGDGRLLLERFVARPHHVEVQVFGDRGGNVVHLFERECSVQRRHQKVIEEAPSPLLDEDLRTAMTDAAVALAAAVGYVSAGTVEFLVSGEDRSFFFIEMNTRLQVEHPVTELTVTANGGPVDLVEWQLRVAAGEPMPASQADLSRAGHAIELRVCAEDATRGFVPQVGIVLAVDAPDGARWDSGIEAGSAVTSHWDSMVAKLVVAGHSRDDAIAGLAAAVDGLWLPGIVVNTDVAADILRDPVMRAGTWTTDLLDQWIEGWRPAQVTDDQVAAVAAAVADQQRAPGSPWTSLGPWRLGAGHGWSAHVVAPDGSEHHVVVAEAAASEEVVVDGSRAWHRAHARPFALMPATAHARAATDVEAALHAPMPGSVVSVDVAPGDVHAGQVLLVIEAMKMQHAIRAPADGQLEAIHVGIGDAVDPTTRLVTFTPAS